MSISGPFYTGNKRLPLEALYIHYTVCQWSGRGAPARANIVWRVGSGSPDQASMTFCRSGANLLPSGEEESGPFCNSWAKEWAKWSGGVDARSLFDVELWQSSSGFISRVSVVRSHPPLVVSGNLIEAQSAAIPCKSWGVAACVFSRPH